jgi:hypothetical protein
MAEYGDEFVSFLRCPGIFYLVPAGDIESASAVPQSYLNDNQLFGF